MLPRNWFIWDDERSQKRIFQLRIFDQNDLEEVSWNGHSVASDDLKWWKEDFCQPPSSTAVAKLFYSRDNLKKNELYGGPRRKTEHFFSFWTQNTPFKSVLLQNHVLKHGTEHKIKFCYGTAKNLWRAAGWPCLYYYDGHNCHRWQSILFPIFQKCYKQKIFETKHGIFHFFTF